jgi:hypothetical protein
LAVILMLMLAGSALAQRPATKRERKAVVAAALAVQDIGAPQAPCVRIRVSSADRDWASLSFPNNPTRACAPYTANGISLYHWHRGRWRFVVAGSEFRCPIHGVPMRVARDLGACL